MSPLLISLLAACFEPRSLLEEPRPEGWFDPGVAESRAAPALQLYLEEGRYTLPDTSLPPGYDVDRRVVVDLKPTRGARWRGRLPFVLGKEAQRFAPPGMRVLVDGERIPWGRGVPSWSLRDGHLLVTAAIEPGIVEVAWEGMQAATDRRQFARAGLPPEAFVRYQLTLSDLTRDGLLLPTPATAEWDVKLPDGEATFQTWLALEDNPIPADHSDGAVVVVSVVEEGRETEVGRHALTGSTSSFTRWDLDLSRWAGREVTLRLSTDPAGTPWFDYVFLGSPTVHGPEARDVRRVIVIGLDTTRPDHMSFYGYERRTTPDFDRILGQSAVFRRAYTPAPRTRPSFRSATTGRNPLDAVGATNIGEVFQANGFATAGIVANVHLQPRFGFHRGFDAWRYDSRADAAEQVNRALAWLRDQGSRDAYLFLHLMDPHIFYRAPGPYRDMFVEDPDPRLPDTFNRWQVYAMERSGELDERRKEHIEALYDGEMAYMSVHLARFFDELDRMGGQNLVIVHSDHGEEFWEHGGFEHNHSLYRETTDAVLAIRPGRGMASPLNLETPVTLADIAPTLYDFAGFGDTPTVDGRSLRPLLEGDASDPGWERPIGIAHLRYGHEQWGVVVDRHKYVVHTGSGREELYDLEADPGEQHDLSGERDTTQYHRALAEAHGMRVGHGWRLFVDARANSEPVEFALPRGPLHAGLIDPERTVDNPANQAWGEPPTRKPEEIGVTRLEGTRFVWEPGTAPRGGLLVVLWGEQVDPATLRVIRGGRELELEEKDGALVHRGGDLTVRVVPGTVVVPPMDEATRIAQLREGGGEVADDQMALLESLGYVGGDDEGGNGGDTDAGDPHGH